ncbi:exonuclease domain-containing protein [Neobacillus niacini]|uniref:exonuclease domain-containing protein n=1 Tax=Neobacillus niacini TaxID=86668 RepID=UPI0020423EA3|nr:exonuclease domain-containing protein [Neobacillus niacini]MCM3693812.1 exonuclease domain-containing protein [Neobacillus niacini]
MGMSDMIHFFRQMSGRLGSNVYAGVQGHANMQNISFIRKLQKEMKENNCLDTPLPELKIVVFDIETTGFYPEKGDRVISIGAIKMTGKRIIETETFYSLVHSPHKLSDEISDLTNIRDEELQSAPPASEVLMEFFKFVQNNALVAHHAKHEQSFMQKMTWDLLKTRFEHRIIDTSFLLRLSNPTIKSLPLEDVCKECEIEIINRHHALEDAKLTALIWGHYLGIAQEKGYQNLREIYEYLAKIK